MGTISDKLMRIINTKEDIRQALILKGYDVPTSIPFKEYAKMISDLPCKVDDFPKLPGDVTRWHFGGLTNEMMAAMDDPRIEDADHKGRFLSFKNFAWSGMSGAGGYNQNFNQWGYGNLPPALQTYTPHKMELNIPSTLRTGNVYSNLGKEGDIYDFTLNIVGLKDGASLDITKGVVSGNIERIKKDGIYKIYQPLETSWDQLRIYIVIHNPNLVDLNITIEQLPIYPGALVFDGVDDYGVCDNFPILTKEKGYTVVALRQWITRGEGALGLVSNVKNWLNNGAFLLEYRNVSANHLNKPISFGAIGSENDLPYILTYQTSKSYNGVSITTGNFEGTDVLHVGKLAPSNVGTCINAAIWELVFLDHDATEEELTKIKDYFVKTYPWLFPDQAWTVVGKTNEDEDRATIANITGNGNDLVLSNFGFAEGSGYGLYKLNFNNWFANSGSGNVNIVNVVNPHKIVLEQSQEAVGAFFLGKNVSYSGELKISVSNKPSDIELSFGSSALGRVILNEGINIVKINPVNTSIGFFTNKAFEAQNIIIEQIPEYEGYLVTDGVDDKVESSLFTLNKDWTIVGNWTMLSNIPSNCGIIKVSSMFLYNSLDGVTIYFAGGPIKIQSKSINAFCSDGRIYLNDWTEILKPDAQIASGGSKSSLNIASYSANFTKMAFKNLAIYDGKNLSKDECIKAYNYLQTLKAK